MALIVNGERVAPERIDHEKERMRPSYERVFSNQPVEQLERQLAEWARENVIEAVLFEQAARVEFPEISDGDIDALLNPLLEQEGETGVLSQRLSGGDAERRKVRQEAAAQIRTERLLQKIAASLSAPKDKDIRRYYERHIERFTVPEMVRAAHIVKHPSAETAAEQQKAEMDNLLVKLQAGADFAAAAAEHSACPQNGGDLGYFPRGHMVPSFEDAVFDLSPGQISGVFATEFGWHIAKVLDRKPAAPCPLEQVQQVIVKELTQQAHDKAVEQYLDRQREKAIVEED